MAKSDYIQGKSWAVIGANDDPTRYGAKVYRHLKAMGYRVFAVNPKLQTVDGDPCWPDLGSLPEKPDAIDFVVSPAVGEKHIRDAAVLGIKRLWFQPGTWRDDFADLATELGLETVQSCVLVEIN